MNVVQRVVCAATVAMCEGFPPATRVPEVSSAQCRLVQVYLNIIIFKINYTTTTPTHTTQLV